LSRLMSDVAQVQAIVSRESCEVAASVLELLLVGGLLLWLDARLTAICVLVFPLLIGLVALFQQRLYRISRTMQERREALSAQLQESLSGMRLIQSLAIEERRLAATGATSARLRDTVVRSEVLGSGVNLLTTVLTDLPLTLFVWGYGGYLVLSGSLTLGSLLAFYEYLMMLYGPVIRIFRFNLNLQVARAAVDRLYEVLDSRPAVADLPGARPLAVPHGRIRFEEVSLAYEPAAPPSVQGLTLEVAPGEVLGLVGPSGAGKSTVVNGLLRFLRPAAGRILIDGQDLEQVTLASLRRQVGLVSQEVFLFSDTIAANIALGRPEATDEAIAAAARAAQSSEFIDELPDRYRTAVGERGLGLSGGERQRIALARAFLQDPPILVLDEATSSLDARSEELIRLALAELVRGRTAIVVAHRFSTLRLCHRIAVLAGGRLVELGSPEELAARDGLYRALLQAQLLEAPPPPCPEPPAALAAGGAGMASDLPVVSGSTAR
ncbi:MAG: ABC transporter ATP-binding protein, partial [Deltaproteobacteria bacterium]|nr:ABC transporter ATP-binding protein [Deltaproteobacteria bacterium]